MDKLKNILKSDTPSDETTPGATGKISGQGSHFSSQSAAHPDTVSGTDPQSRGPSDVSAALPDRTAAALTRGPEQGGTSHVSTTAAAPTTQSSNLSAPEPVAVHQSAAPAGNPAASSNTHGAKEYNVTSADFPKADRSADGSGTAAIGQTTTYSSARLTEGDPTTSVIDRDSSDPLTYKHPEHGAGATGVTAGAAGAAATAAFSANQGSKEPLSSTNPYKSSAPLDPRVDGGASSHHTGSAADTARPAAALGATTGTTAPSTARAPDQISTGHSNSVAPAQLTSTTDPVSRSADYTQATTTKGLDQTATSSTTSPTSATTEPQQSTFGKILGAVGLGGIAGAAGATAADRESTSAVDTTPSQPTTVTGVDSYTAPTESGPPKHYRRESIPTTAYPSGSLESNQPINPPVGGTGQTTSHHTARDTAVGAGVAGLAGSGAAAAGGHEFEKCEAHGDGATGGRAAPPLNETESGVPRNSAHHLTTTGATGTSGTAAPHSDSHAHRNEALGAGAGAAAVGAGAYGTHEYSKKQAEEAAKTRALAEEEHSKRLEAQRKEAEKEHKRELKEEKQHEKAIEKEHHKHEKEVAAAEKQHEKEVKQHEKDLKQHQKEAAEAEKRHEKELAAAGATGTAGVVATEEHDKHHKHNKLHKEPDVEDKEKKPSLLKRIFRSRKNSRGEDEQYEEEVAEHEHEHGHGHGSGAGKAAVAGGAVGTAGGAAAAGYEHDRTSTAGTTDPLASTHRPEGSAGFVSTDAQGHSKYTIVPTPEQSTSATGGNTTAPVGTTHTAGGSALGEQHHKAVAGTQTTDRAGLSSSDPQVLDAHRGAHGTIPASQATETAHTDAAGRDQTGASHGTEGGQHQAGIGGKIAEALKVHDRHDPAHTEHRYV